MSTVGFHSFILFLYIASKDIHICTINTYYCDKIEIESMAFPIVSKTCKSSLFMILTECTAFSVCVATEQLKERIRSQAILRIALTWQITFAAAIEKVFKEPCKMLPPCSCLYIKMLWGGISQYNFLHGSLYMNIYPLARIHRTDLECERKSKWFREVYEAQTVGKRIDFQRIVIASHVFDFSAGVCPHNASIYKYSHVQRTSNLFNVYTPVISRLLEFRLEKYLKLFPIENTKLFMKIDQSFYIHLRLRCIHNLMGIEGAYAPWGVRKTYAWNLSIFVSLNGPQFRFFICNELRMYYIFAYMYTV